VHGDLLPEARVGWGCLRSAWVSPAGGAGGVGEAGKSVWVSLCEGAGGEGEAGRSVWVSPCEGAGGVECRRVPWVPIYKEPGQGRWDIRSSGSVGDRGGGTSSPSPSAPPPMAISPRSSAWGDPGEEPDTAVPLISQALPTPPGRGRGRSAEGAGGVGEASEVSGYPLPKARVGWGGEDMWDLGSVRDRGGGTRSPSPSAPPPVAISPRSSIRE